MKNSRGLMITVMIFMFAVAFSQPALATPIELFLADSIELAF